MKPTKNQIFCIGCKHRKMLFESQSKADNFIKFNSAEIAEQSGKAPLRSYYCSFCCGWHITSVALDKAVARDERDAQVWKKIKQVFVSKKKRKPTIEVPVSPKSRKFPKSEEGNELLVLAKNIDKTIACVESALYNVDIQELQAQFDILLSLEKELRYKSSEYGIDITSIDKRYENIAQTKALFYYVFDYFIDRKMRQEYLSSLSEDELMRRENQIISNIEIIERIKTSFEHINLLSYTTDQVEIQELCDNILTNLVPQLKGATAKLKRSFVCDAEEILACLSRPKLSGDNHYRNLILSIIEHLEDAYNAYNMNDFDNCETSLIQAELLMPKISTDVEMTLYNQIVNLRNLIS